MAAASPNQSAKSTTTTTATTKKRSSNNELTSALDPSSSRSSASSSSRPPQHSALTTPQTLPMENAGSSYANNDGEQKVDLVSIAVTSFVEEELAGSRRETKKDITMKEKKMKSAAHNNHHHNRQLDSMWNGEGMTYGALMEDLNHRSAAGEGTSLASEQRSLPSHRSRLMTDEANKCYDSRKSTILYELRNAFQACGEEISANRHSGQMVIKWVVIKEILQKAIRGDLKAARDMFMTEFDASALATYGESDSLNSSASVNSLQDILDDESQIHRLTSWGTYTTTGTYDSLRASTAGDSVKGDARVIFDDQGNVIDPVLFEKAQRQHEQRMFVIGRKRKVKFDYPPISSLREYPRPKPDEVENMFFSEHELEQIEDDRYSTMSADDVEIVAISTSNDSNEQRSSKSSPKNPAAETPAGGKDTNFKNYVSTPRGRRSKRFGFEEGGSSENSNGTRSRSGTPGPVSRRGRSPSPGNPGGKSSSSTTPRGRHSQQTATDDTNPSSSDQRQHQSQRMLKSVQIYLRERSLNY